MKIKINTLEPYTTISNTNFTLSRNHSGSIVFIDESNFENFSVLRLPPPEHGLNFKMINKPFNSSKTLYIKSYNSSNELSELLYKTKSIVGSTNPSLTNTLTILFTSCDIGDELNFICDGTNWFVNGIVSNTAGYDT